MTFSAITADTGFLVGVERSKQNALLPLQVAIARKLPIAVAVGRTLNGGATKPQTAADGRLRPCAAVELP
jgi:hypothetical protein